MPLSPAEQKELDQLELEQLEAEYAASQTTPPPTESVSAMDFVMENAPIGGGLNVNAKKLLGFGADMAVESGGAAAGQAIGAPFAPVTAGLSVPIGGFIGGAAGNALAQMRRDEPFSVGEMVGAGIGGAVPGAPLASAPAKTLMKEGLKSAGTNIAAVGAEDLIEGNSPSLGRYALAGVGGMAAPQIGRFMDSGARAERAANKAIENSVRDETLAAARAAGYVVPPSKVNPSAINKILESFAGKADTAYEATIRNQEVTNSLAKKAIGAPGSAPITLEVLKDVRAEAAAPYREIADMSPKAAKDLDALKQIRYDAKDTWAKYNRDPDPVTRKAAEKLDAEAAALETKLENRAMLSGREDLVPAMKEARKRLAKTYEVENALNLATGDIEAPKLARSIDRLTDDLETIARFQQAFKKYSSPGSATPPPGVSKIRAWTPLFYGAAGYAGAGPAGMAAAAIPLAEGPVRSGILSSRYAKYMGQPFYGQAISDVPAELGRFATMSASRKPEPAPSRPMFMTPIPQL